MARKLKRQTPRQRRLLGSWRRHHGTRERSTATAMRRFWNQLAAAVESRWMALEGGDSPSVEDLLLDSDGTAFGRVYGRQVQASYLVGVDFEARLIESAGRRVQGVEDGLPDGPPSLPPSFIFDDLPERHVREVRRYLRLRGPGIWERLDDNGKKRLRSAITKGLRDGLTHAEMAKQLRARVEGIGRRSAMALARTETTGAMNFAQQVERNRVDVPSKEWISTMDERNRGMDPKTPFDHVAPNGTVVDNDAAFDISGEQLRYPADPNGSPGNVINCRCAVVASFEPSKRSRPARRRPTRRKPSQGPTTVQPKAKAVDLGDDFTFTGPRTEFGDKIRGMPEMANPATLDDVQAIGKAVVDDLYADPEVQKRVGHWLEDSKKHWARLDKAAETVGEASSEVAKAEKWLAKTEAGTPRRRKWLLKLEQAKEKRRELLDKFSRLRKRLAVRIQWNETQMHELMARKLRERLAQVRDMGRGSSKGANVGKPLQRWEVSRTSDGRERWVPDADRMTPTELEARYREAENLYPTDAVELMGKLTEDDSLRMQHVTRGYANRGQKRITTSGKGEDAVETFVHEIGHFMEDAVLRGRVAPPKGLEAFQTMPTSVAQLEAEWLKRRTLPGQTNTRIFEWNKHELGIEDKLAHVNHYVGRDYGRSSYEVFSIGAENVLMPKRSGNGYGIWTDRDYLETVVGILLGI